MRTPNKILITDGSPVLVARITVGLLEFYS
jgi:hypothetical protein